MYRLGLNLCDGHFVDDINPGLFVLFIAETDLKIDAACIVSKEE